MNAFVPSFKYCGHILYIVSRRFWNYFSRVFSSHFKLDLWVMLTWNLPKLSPKLLLKYFVCNWYLTKGGAFSVVSISRLTHLISSYLGQTGYKMSHFSDTVYYYHNLDLAVRNCKNCSKGFRGNKKKMIICF